MNAIIGLCLILISAAIYFTQYILFNSPRDTFFYFFQDLAFVPLQVFIVTLIIERILNAREKREILRKINVVISAFYTEVGSSAISILSAYIRNIDELRLVMNVCADWKEENFKAAVKSLNLFEFEVVIVRKKLQEIKEFLITKKDFLLSLFENTNLLEHDNFTDMLWALFHFLDELESRESLEGLPEKDLEHLEGDINRAYRLLIIEWLYYMNHLKKEYPYLFSLAVRKNPFKENKTVVFR